MNDGMSGVKTAGRIGGGHEPGVSIAAISINGVGLIITNKLDDICGVGGHVGNRISLRRCGIVTCNCWIDYRIEGNALPIVFRCPVCRIVSQCRKSLNVNCFVRGIIIIK